MKIFFSSLVRGTRNARSRHPLHQMIYIPTGAVSAPYRKGTATASILASLLLVGCGNTLYLVKINQAERNFEEAQELGAEEYAPYEYYSAKVRLEEAKRQAAQAEYGPASDLSDEAYDYSVKAINVSKSKHKSGSEK